MAHSPQDEMPDISFVMPCYNENAIVGFTVQRLASAFERAGHRLQLVAIDNGSVDRTGEELQRLRKQLEAVEPIKLEVNRGYGYGVLEGIRYAARHGSG